MECKECGEEQSVVTESQPLCWDCFGEMLVEAENLEQQKKTSAEEE